MVMRLAPMSVWGFQPEAFTVAAIFDAQEGAGQVDAAQLLPRGHHFGRLHGLGHGTDGGFASLSFGVEKHPAFVVGFAPAFRQIEIRWQFERHLGRGDGSSTIQQTARTPVTIGRLKRGGSGEAAQQRSRGYGLVHFVKLRKHVAFITVRDPLYAR